MLIALALAWAAASGCGQPMNDSNGLLGVEPLQFLQADPISELDRLPALEDDPTRETWPRVTVLVPTHQVQYQLLYRQSPLLVDGLARQRGDHPSVEDALRVEPMGAGHWAEAAVELASPAVGLVDFCGALITGHGPWTVRTSPANPFQRVPTVHALVDEKELRFQMEAE